MHDELPGFVTDLTAAMRRGLERGLLEPHEIDTLIHAPDFDPVAFDTFLAEARRRGVRFPDDGEAAGESEVAPSADHTITDIERRYLAEIQRYPLLERDHEQLLWTAMRDGDENARKSLILAYLRLVVAIARGYRNRGVEFLDLIEEGNLGLIAAVDRYDVDRGVHFSTYATWWIRQALARGVANQSRTVRIPIHVLQMVRRYVATERRLERERRRRPEVSEVASELGLPLARANRLRTLIHAIRTLDVDLGGDAYQGLIDSEALEQPPTIDELIETQMRNQHLDELLKKLSGREEAILRLRYGFYDDKMHTLAEAGEQFGLSRERIRQLEQRALVKLRQLIESDSVESASVH
ncbi:MAG TPA: RNA polymerase sigma factor RpoD/SigA [Candidatus Polarisedimenticolia bacterium]|nr:RNA polymerase sigma factor RpoD/SigA [Candidatus Polarisedimenticolia bacterium]